MLLDWAHEVLIMSVEKKDTVGYHMQLVKLVDAVLYASIDCRSKVVSSCVPVLKYIAFNHCQLPKRSPEEEVSCHVTIAEPGGSFFNL